MKDEHILENLLSRINNEELRVMVRTAIEPVWDTFVQISASKSGKYHPEVSNLKPYGLVNHTLRVMWFCDRFFEEEKLDAPSRDEILAAAILHDIGKVFYYKRWESIDHGELGAEMAKKAGLNENICAMIKNHMAHWEGKPLKNIHQRILAYADYLASRKEISITMSYYEASGEEHD